MRYPYDQKGWVMFSEWELENPNVTQKVSMARSIAISAHKGQLYNFLPYIHHVARVVANLRAQDITEEEYHIVAWLHDVVEDTDIPLDMITHIFGEEIGQAVDAISRRKGTNHWKESEDRYLTRVMENEIAAKVKFADVCDNLLMTQSRHAPEHKKNLYRKYINAAMVLSTQGITWLWR